MWKRNEAGCFMSSPRLTISCVTILRAASISTNTRGHEQKNVKGILRKDGQRKVDKGRESGQRVGGKVQLQLFTILHNYKRLKSLFYIFKNTD